MQNSWNKIKRTNYKVSTVRSSHGTKVVLILDKSFKTWEQICKYKISLFKEHIIQNESLKPNSQYHFIEPYRLNFDLFDLSFEYWNLIENVSSIKYCLENQLKQIVVFDEIFKILKFGKVLINCFKIFVPDVK